MMNDSLTILVIDDDGGARKFCHKALKSAFGDSLRFMEAEDGESGLSAIERHVPHCVLLDHLMPGIDGIEVLKRIRVRYPYLPVVMIDGNGNDVIAVQSMKEGAQDYIAKTTITPPIMQRVVEMAIQHCTLQKRTHDQRLSLEIFTRALAHDLKEPVRTIRSFLDSRFIDWRNLSDQSQKYFHYVRKAADRMDALIDNVYLYTRLDASEQMEKGPCNVADVLVDVQDNLAQLIEERGATIVYDALPCVFANRVQMIQLFQNLITNAIRHCDKAVTIRVGCEEHEGLWRLAVRDNGPGIASDDFARIFAPFKRLSQRKGDDPGLGLGLAINRKIVESYGGKIWCESTLGAGTCFLFTLPKATAFAGADGPHSLPVASLNESGGGAQALARILLVDDNEADIVLNRILLIDDVKLRCDVLTAGDGKQALAALQRAANENNPIDLVLLDINMPVMSGFELLSYMRKNEALLRPLVVMCSTSASDIDKRMAASFDVAGYLTKPPRFSLLKDIIDDSQRLQLRHEGNELVLRRAA
jgi:signal transduction histidine kinase